MTRLRQTAVFVAAGLLTPFALAQINIADNDLRTDLNDVVRVLQTLQSRLDGINNSFAHLRRDNELLRTLLAEVHETLNQTSTKAQQREADMGKILGKVSEQITRLEANHAQNFQQLRTLIDNMDAQVYTRALREYNTNGDVEVALQELQWIVSLGKLSSYMPAARHWIGYIQYEQGDFDAANTTLLALLNDHPGAEREPETLFILAQMALLLNQTEAVAWQQRILRLYPNSYAADQVRATL